VKISALWRAGRDPKFSLFAYGSFDLEINMIGKFLVGSLFGAETHTGGICAFKDADSGEGGHGLRLKAATDYGGRRTALR